MEDSISDIEFKSLIGNIAQEVNDNLGQWLPKPSSDTLGSFYEAIRYSTLAGGKRIRPFLSILVATSFGGNRDQAMRAGCALELIHTYSLIHDDLPAMDNDDFRRGKPTNHKVYGEPIAILAGDGLLTLAFNWLSSLNEFGVNDLDTLKIIRIVSEASGINGMVGGQVLDLANSDVNISINETKRIHKLKTGMLIKAAVQIGAIIGHANDDDYKYLIEFAEKIGLLFQIIDDILDIEGDLSLLGKTPGKDEKLGKATYPVLIGMDKTIDLAKQTFEDSLVSLKKMSIAIPELRKVAEYIYNRKN